MNTALVAGGGGFIGSHLCEKLLNQGVQVIAVDSFITGQKSNVKHLLGHPQFQLIEADIRTPWPNWLGPKTAEQLTEIYNLASPASPVGFAKMPEFILTTSSEGHKNLLELAKSMQPKKKIKVLLASTSEVYGDPLVHPQSESYWGNVNSIGPRSCYDEAKRFAEALSMAYARQFGIQVRIARIFNTYGPRMRPTDGRVICNFMTQALRGEPLTIYGNGEQTRSFCYVEDLVLGLIALANCSETGPFNIGNPDEYSILQTATLVSELLNVPHRVEFLNLPVDDPKRRKPDISKAIEVLNWKPKVSFRDGLLNTLSFFSNTTRNS